MMKTLLAVSVLALGLTSFVGVAADSAHGQKVTHPVAMQSDDMAVKHDVASEKGKSHKATDDGVKHDERLRNEASPSAQGNPNHKVK
ncbi:hypothetical protein A6J66_000205 [Yersinia enterocolitica]|nr:hypothetical protein A6J66_000205 [Yersinia enterocolitica]